MFVLSAKSLRETTARHNVVAVHKNFSSSDTVLRLTSENAGKTHSQRCLKHSTEWRTVERNKKKTEETYTEWNIHLVVPFHVFLFSSPVSFRIVRDLEIVKFSDVLDGTSFERRRVNSDVSRRTCWVSIRLTNFRGGQKMGGPRRWLKSTLWCGVSRNYDSLKRSFHGISRSLIIAGGMKLFCEKFIHKA